MKALTSENAPHRRGRHPLPLQVRLPVGELAVRVVDLAPLVIEGHDLGHLVLQETVQCLTGTAVGQLPVGPSLDPPIRPQFTQLQLPASSAKRPPGVDARSSRSSSPAFLAASTRRGTRPLSPSAPSLDTTRMPAIVARSTAHRSAASAIVTSRRTSCSQISYFCSGVRKRFARRLRDRFSVGIEHDQMLLHDRGDARMLTDRSCDLYRELRRNGLTKHRVLLRPRRRMVSGDVSRTPQSPKSSDALRRCLGG